MLSPKPQPAEDEIGKAEKDSPAFCLRPRRSTPKPSASPGNGNGLYSLLKNSSLLEKLNSQATGAVKRRLFRLPIKEEDDGIKFKSTTPSPSKSIVKNVNMGIFVEKITASDLEGNSEYPLKYVSLRIVQIIPPSVEVDRLVLMAEEASSEDMLKQGKNFLQIDLFDVYAKSSITPGKVIEITKFKTEPNPASSSEINGEVVDLFPVKIIVKPLTESAWIPFVSINEKYENVVNPKMLNVSTLVTSKCSQPHSRMTSFISKPNVAKMQSEAKPAAVDPDGQEKNATSKETLDDNRVIQTRKRTRSITSITITSVSRETHKRGCSSSHI
ncbi:hypothetical protein HDE_02339 [Halotydeus destructor]|nr:hypothetical protein HDE_02339 [Halotydeus destructor]